MWIIAAHDRGEPDGDVHKCNGCIWYTHDNLMQGSGDMNTWRRGNRDPYPILIAFGCVLFVFWLISGIVGCASSTTSGYRWYIILSVLSYTIFAVIFAIIVDKLKFVDYSASTCSSHCQNNANWFDNHFKDSVQEFWGASLACFILGAYIIAGAVYLYNNPEEGLAKAEEKK